MKTIILILLMLFVNHVSYSQTYKSSYSLNPKSDSETEFKDRIITISDKEITVTNFLDGGVKIWHLIVNRIENKEWNLDGMQKTYYCTDKDKDAMFGNYRKAIAHKTSMGTFLIASFADEATVLVYNFALK